jgi:hypothetical protein
MVDMIQTSRDYRSKLDKTVTAFSLFIHDLCPDARLEVSGYALKAGQLTYDCRYSTMHGMPVTGGRGFRGLKPLWYNGVPP